MSIRVEIEAAPNENEFPLTRIYVPGEKNPCTLRVDFSTLTKLCSSPSLVTLDLLTLAAVVYALDRFVKRESAFDNWTRDFLITLPVTEPDTWTKVKPTMERCLSFLTGDRWAITFAQRTIAYNFTEQGILPITSHPVAVSLFSGGLDSLIGVIDWLEKNPDQPLVLVGHHDPRIAGTLQDQKLVYRDLEANYGSRVQPLFVSVGADVGEETTLRSRSFLFIALGMFAANSISPTTPLVIPENGTISLNVPLTPSRGGSCSTRTTHPYYLTLIKNMLYGLGIANPIETPLQMKTKGESVVECLNQEVLRNAIGHTASCAKRGHKRTWIRRSAKECGRCLPCLYRRAALHKAHLDSQVYGRDFCAGEVDVFTSHAYANDFRAYLSFLRQNPSRKEIVKLLLTNGKLDIACLDDYADIILRAMNEVRALLADKAIDDVKKLAGI